MCGIAGWLDFSGRIPTNPTVIDQMTATMACRGPDDSGTWTDNTITLGHRRLAVIDIHGGKQPMTTHHNNTTAALIYSGEIYNHKQLRTQLHNLGHHFHTTSDTEVLLHAYLQWGPDCVNHLNGMYAFAAWNPHTRELTLARDRLGIKPLYYQQTPNGIIFGSEPKTLLAHPDITPTVTADGLRELFSFIKTPGHALYKNMHELQPGTTLTINPHNTTTRTYWQLTAQPHTHNLPTTITNIHDILQDTVTHQLIADVPLGILLSGGLDSSTITALATNTHPTQPPRTFAVDIAGNAENFITGPMRTTHDAPYARAVARALGTDHHEIMLSLDEVCDPEVTRTALVARDMPTFSNDMDVTLHLLFRALRSQTTVALSGEGADEIFGGYHWFHNEAAINSNTFPWTARVLREGVHLELLDQGLLSKLDIPGYIADNYSDAIREVPVLAGENPKERRMREVGYLFLTRFLRNLLDRKDRLSMAVGLEVRVPYCDHRLVDYVFNIPWTMKNFDGKPKSLLRAAAGQLLPPEILQRPKAAYPTVNDPHYDSANRRRLMDLLSTSDSSVHAVVDDDVRRRLLADPAGRTANRISRAEVDLMLQMDHWLDRYDVRLEL
jgi:asparagine synthase (glutamine-hydrolysing)